MLIETDSPYLAPAPHRGKTNEPAWVGLVGKKIAEIKQMDTSEVANALMENYFALFGKYNCYDKSQYFSSMPEKA
jgi:TatD DNase family protein